MSVSIEKIPGVDSVKVSLTDGKATIHLKPGNTVTFEQVRQAVQRNGFSPQEASVTARGEAIVSGGTLQFKIPGPNAIYDVTSLNDRGVLDGLRTVAGTSVIVEGLIPAAKDKTRVIQVNTFKRAT